MAVYAKTGRFALCLRKKLKIIKYYCRFLKMNDNSIVKTIYYIHKPLNGVGFKKLVY